MFSYHSLFNLLSLLLLLFLITNGYLITSVLYVYQDDYMIFRLSNIKPPLCSVDNANYSWLYIFGFYLSVQVNDMR